MLLREFHAAREAAERALALTSERIGADLTFAGHTARIDVAGRCLFERLFPALSHLGVASTSATPALRIRVWDAERCAIPAPDPVADDPGLNGTIDSSDDRQIVRYRRRTSTAWLDRAGHELVACFPSATRLSLNDRSKPLQLPLSVWHLDHGAPLIHAGVVARHDRGLLFPGKGGSGKSTAALSCALAGYDYVGDDCVAIQISDEAIRAFSVFGSTNVAPHHLARFPTLRSHAIAGTTPEEDKHLVLLSSLLPRPLARSASLVAIVLPTIVSGSATRLVPASRADALRTLAPSTLLFFPGWGAGQLNFLARLVERLPCYRLEMSPDLDHIPACLDQLLDGAR